jgi:hypothetical protein
MLTKDSADQPRRVVRSGLGTAAVAACVFQRRDVWQHQGRYGRVASVHLARRASPGSERWRIEKHHMASDEHAVSLASESGK